ncbi:hypothetical protein EIP91_001308 [Steccherinum ochraceum]|uniref:F-box domain-containing protein n=1 Tax=Steccherinum ochraceum TaxID=92696 RepID=A0A4R0RI70_9APHY|nr:hypothetical protein EIP91_001308 [Steccherinum ochraceum]
MARPVALSPEEDATAKSCSAARPVVRGRRGSLQDLPAMPLDILIEVFSYLQPLDILYLARTSKTLRALLMNKLSAMFWRVARKNVEGFPDCPPFLSEPAEATIRKVSDLDLDADLETADIETQVKIMSAGWDTVQKCFLVHMPYTSTVLDRWKEASVDGRETLTTELLERDKQLNQFAKECNEWQKLKKSSRADELERIREQRLEDIVDRLYEHGWGVELNDIGKTDFEFLKQISEVTEPKPLTDRTWDKIAPTIVEFMRYYSEFKDKKDNAFTIKLRMQQFANPLTQALQALGPKVPHLRDLMGYPKLRDIVDNRCILTVCKPDIDKAINILPKALKWYMKKRRQYFRDIIRKEYPGVPQEADPLLLAVGQCFSCSFCRKPLVFPDILFHYCVTRDEPFKSKFFIKDEYEAAVDDALNVDDWKNCRSFDKDFTLSLRLAGQVIATFGKDPAHATADDMDALDLRVCCSQRRNCAVQDPQVRAVMTWRAAVHHALAIEIIVDHKNKKYLERKHSFTLVSEVEATAARQLELNLGPIIAQKMQEGAEVVCPQCPELVTKDTRYDHAEACHSGYLTRQSYPFAISAQGNVTSRPVYLIKNLKKLKKPSRTIYEGCLAQGTAVVHDFE